MMDIMVRINLCVAASVDCRRSPDRFQELIGEHTGENMATVVWSTLELYGIQNKVCHEQH